MRERVHNEREEIVAVCVVVVVCADERRDCRAMRRNETRFVEGEEDRPVEEKVPVRLL